MGVSLFVSAECARCAFNSALSASHFAAGHFEVVDSEQLCYITFERAKLSHYPHAQLQVHIYLAARPAPNPFLSRLGLCGAHS